MKTHTQNTVQLTDLEKQVLLAVYYSDYQDDRDSGAEGVVGNPVWALDEGDVDMKPGQLSGVISSCIKKGFVGVAVEKNHSESTIWLTQEGFDRIKEFI